MQIEISENPFQLADENENQPEEGLETINEISFNDEAENKVLDTLEDGTEDKRF